MLDIDKHDNYDREEAHHRGDAKNKNGSDFEFVESIPKVMGCRLSIDWSTALWTRRPRILNGNESSASSFFYHESSVRTGTSKERTWIAAL